MSLNVYIMSHSKTPLRASSNLRGRGEIVYYRTRSSLTELQRQLTSTVVLRTAVMSASFLAYKA